MTDLRRSASGAGEYMGHGRKLSVTMSVNSEDGDSHPLSRPTRSRIGPLPPNGPSNPLFPPLPPKLPRPPREKGDRSRSNSAQGVTPSKRRSALSGTDADGEEGDAAGVVKLEMEVDEPIGEASSADLVNAQVLLEAESTIAPSPLPASLVDPPTAPVSATTPITPSAPEAADEEGGDEWDSYRKRHLGHIKPFASAPSRSEARRSPSSSGGEEPAEQPSGSGGGTDESRMGAAEGGKPSFDPLDCVLPSEAFLADPTNTIIPLSQTAAAAAAAMVRPAVAAAAPFLQGVKPASGGARGKKVVVVAPTVQVGARAAARGKVGTGAGVEEGEVRDKDVTRCVCEKDDIDVMMIQCDYCEVWQHGACVGVWGDEEAPDEYYCDECRPGLHAPLKRLFKLRAKRGQGFTPPTSWDLMHHHYPSDRIKPSQSKRWIDPSIIKVHFEAPANSKSGSDAGKDKPKRSHHRKPLPGGGVEDGKDGEREGSAQASGSVSSRDGVKTGRDSERKDSTGPAQRALSPPGGGRPPNSTGSHAPNSKKSVSHRRASTTPSDSLSEHPIAPPPRKRNTMNSRDAAYDNAIAASLLEAGLGGPVKELLSDEKRRRKGEEMKERERDRRDEDGGDGGEEEDGDVEMEDVAEKGGRDRKRRRDEDGDEEEAGADEEDALPAKRPRKKKGEFDELDIYGKNKHANQYTYRPKSAAPAGNHIVVSTPKQPLLSPVKKAAVPREPVEKPDPPSKRHVMIKEPRASTPSLSRPDSAISSNGLGNLTWGLPDHLMAFAHLLPEAPPAPLELVTPRPINSKMAMRDVNTSHTHQTHFEAPTKVRYPAKRVTVGEMRKRVRSVLEYVGGVQMEEVKRMERAKLLGLLPPVEPEVVVKEVKDVESSRAGETTQEITMLVTTSTTQESSALATSSSASSGTSTSAVSRSMQLMDELTRDLIRFQEMFEPGAMGMFSMPVAGPSHTAVEGGDGGGAMEVDA